VSVAPAIIVYVGSTRPAKVGAVEDALAAIGALEPRFAAAEIRALDVGAAAPAMPMTEAEIVTGAAARVGELIRRAPSRGSGTFFVGLEGGLDPVAGVTGPVRYAAKTWVCASDGAEYSYGAGPSLMLPSSVVADVLAGNELGEVVDRLAGAAVRGTRGAWGLLTRDLVGRRDAFRLAVVAAFAPFYNPAAFGSSPRCAG